MPAQRSLANLKPYQPGQSGNRQGRPSRTASLHRLIHAELAKKDPHSGELQVEELLHHAVQQAIHSPNPRWAELVLSYAYGKPEQPVRLIEEQVRRIAIAEGKDPDRAVTLMHEYARRLA